ncbi:uncharacterized protein PGTG_12386 [Puccinia graminis f. sp. tritici CRL 75-36-700-3]|uniref:Uncharacterized protein n=1 Tax=Puccinia graminis f. sp. tritici (strain CRL 75-36-700-3 / race SCCL) TaxID=418459 RepID=E3KQ55_PUCGT|nr:uncharacterized protein PGTG_12386 [Puccinia graminis f. sp. tritici CRL 75-36-700-3]EFP86430.1 hypothetical protein PGTG_12386 [Puccinia graminis f. sp. tritici CRL 75-36-700-3]
MALNIRVGPRPGSYTLTYYPGGGDRVQPRVLGSPPAVPPLPHPILLLTITLPNPTNNPPKRKRPRLKAPLTKQPNQPGPRAPKTRSKQENPHKPNLKLIRPGPIRNAKIGTWGKKFPPIGAKFSLVAMYPAVLGGPRPGCKISALPGGPRGSLRNLRATKWANLTPHGQISSHTSQPPPIISSTPTLNLDMSTGNDQSRLELYVKDQELESHPALKSKELAHLQSLLALVKVDIENSDDDVRLKSDYENPFAEWRRC